LFTTASRTRSREQRRRPANRNVGILGANIAHQCLDAGLLDEIVVQVASVLLGDGVRLFDRPECRQIKLDKTSVAESRQLTDLRFRVLN
jgi:dihydrofolate reductase